jgi:hypothetical protein
MPSDQHQSPVSVAHARRVLAPGVLARATHARAVLARRKRRNGLGAALALCLCVQLAPAQQQPTGDVARLRAAETFRQGVEAFDRRDFEAARVAFLQTLALRPNEPAVQRNLGLSEIYSGHYLDGARRLARVLQTTSQGSSEERSRMQDSLKKAETHLQRLTIEVDVDGADIVIEGTELGRSPLPFAWYLAPGPYDVSVSKPGYESWSHAGVGQAGRADHLRIVLERSDADAVSAAPVATPAPPAPVPDTAPRARRGGVNPWLVAGGAVLSAAAIGSGLTFSILANDNEQKAARLGRRVQLGGGDCDPRDGAIANECTTIDAALKQHDRQLNYALVSYAAGATLGVLTVVYTLFLASDSREEKVAPSASFVLDRDRAGLLVTGSF